MSPSKYARKLEQWAAVGVHYDIIVAARAALEDDRRESVGRVPKKSGRLAGTIRVSEPSAARFKRKGYFAAHLSAGSRAKGDPVKYALVLQTGKTYAGASRSVPHDIPGGVKLPDGSMRHAVHHPGGRFVAHHYLRVEESRAARYIDTAITKSAAAL